MCVCTRLLNCAIVPSALLCFGVCLASHVFTRFSTSTAATLYLPSPSTRTISLFVGPSSLSYFRSGARCPVPQNAVYSQYGGYRLIRDITKSPIGRSFETGPSTSRCTTTPPYRGSPTVYDTRGALLARSHTREERGARSTAHSHRTRGVYILRIPDIRCLETESGGKHPWKRYSKFRYTLTVSSRRPRWSRSTCFWCSHINSQISSPWSQDRLQSLWSGRISQGKKIKQTKTKGAHV